MTLAEVINETDDVISPRLRLVRPFHRGLLLINDRGSADLPTDAPLAPDLATATASAIAINVRHAQDVSLHDEPAEVTIEIFLAGAPEGTADVRANLDVLSGTLELGDAEATHELEIGRGTWTLAINATPADHPELVRLWLERQP